MQWPENKTQSRAEFPELRVNKPTTPLLKNDINNSSIAAIAMGIKHYCSIPTWTIMLEEQNQRGVDTTIVALINLNFMVKVKIL